ncbi:unnamed protein product [Cyprideis torosa]|uniref:Uncharacterized protein n=1 Tax=Cyprideis torosa TaxID=163714 RepID=A0A7R8WB57_9CRUS|nr:unnamed protein product [Cyprideis torosa]CAG0889148.1 unnamed protein product [Cyprideis torosa]
MLEYQCITGLAFVRNELECLDCPIWVMIINVVAMDMLKSKLPPVKRMLDPRSRPRLPLPDEDPYSVAGSGGSGSSGSSNGPQLRHPSGVPVPGGGPFERPPKPPPSGREKPPKLPPREKEPTYAVLPKDRSGESSPPSENLASKFAQLLSSRQKKEKKDRKYEDPYYCGFSARVSSFARPRNERKQNAPLPSLPVGAHSQMWHSRSYDSGMASLSYGGYQRMSSEGSEIYGHLRDPKYDVVKRRNPPQVYPYIQAPLQQSSHTVPNFAEMIESDYAPLNGSGGGESPYERIYGRLPLPNRSYIPSHTRNFLCRDWE